MVICFLKTNYSLPNKKFQETTCFSSKAESRFIYRKFLQIIKIYVININIDNIYQQNIWTNVRHLL